jgi:hypothetical protein
MAKEKPPITGRTWFMREVLEPGTPVASVACAEGCIMVGGTQVFRVGPGSWDVQHRGLPAGAELPLSIAMEPRPPFRIAVGPESGDVILFTDTVTASSITGHAFTAQHGSKQALELAWVVHEARSSLFARTDDGDLYWMETEGWARLDLPPVHAIAHDEQRGFAALTVVDGIPRLHTTADAGATWDVRALGVEVEAAPDAPASMAISGQAVAVVIGDSGPLVSRRPGERATRYAGLPRAYALAFQGSEPDGWIYVALRRTEAEPAAVALLGPDGSVVKVMDFLADDHAPLDLGPIAWDSSRQALMVSSRGGLIAMGPDVSQG